MPAFRFRWWYSWRILALMLLILFVIARWNFAVRESRWSLAAAEALPAGRYRVTEVIDGDTLRIVAPTANLSQREFTVRLLGINAPEATTKIEPFGPAATAFLREMIADKEVIIEWDKRRIDKYGRRLGYVSTSELFVNQELISRGLARVFAYPGDNSTIARELSRAQEAAQRAGVGIWSLTAAPSAEAPSGTLEQ